MEAAKVERDSDGAARARGSDIYIVQLRADPAIAYSGEMAGFAATRPAPGQKLDANSAAVKKYTGYLKAIQNEIINSVGAEKVYNYVYSLNGFAARMSPTAAKRLAKRPDVANVWKDEIRPLTTDKSPAWIGVTQEGGAWYKGFTGEDVVIASIDTGAWPENPSFADVSTPILGNFGPRLYLNGIPDGFTSSGCDFGNSAKNPADADFTCNRKLLSARCYNASFSSGADASSPCGFNGSRLAGWEFHSARDTDGHGSHTAATAGGNYGVKARANGEFLGRVSGIAPRARLAFYKVCWDGTSGSGCGSADSAAAIDQAVADGVDVINFSVGGSSTIFNGADDIAFLFAADAGVHVATSNGNSGPEPQTTGTPAGVPWLTAVGNSQDDGAFFTRLTIHTPANVAGPIFANEGSGSTRLIDVGPVSGDIVPTSDPVACGAVDPIDGIALVSRGGCTFTTKYLNAAAAGADAIIVYNNTSGGLSMSVGDVPIPGVSITQAQGQALAAETGVTGTMAAVSAANQIAGSSSRGPNGGAMDMIKPDVVAPGTSILAAYSPENGGNDFAAISGTSMASPHVAGAFALLKQAHPDWTPAQSKSALMTTARQNLYKTYGLGPADPFDMGAGEILPTDALNPGLTYDAGFLDYLAFLCGVPDQAFIVGPGLCSAPGGAGYSLDASDLNTASIAIADLLDSQTVTRTVTNVTKGKWRWKSRKTFKAYVDMPPGVEVLLSDWSLDLKGGESASYEIYFTVKKNAKIGEWVFGSITWKEVGGDIEVRSPIAVRPAAIAAPYEVDDIADSNGDGSLDVPVQFGYTGDYDATVSGMEEPGYFIGTVDDGEEDGWCFTLDFLTGAATHLRFATFDRDTTDPGNDDLDLDIYFNPAGCSLTGMVPVGASGGATSNEVVDASNPQNGTYIVFVDGYAASNGSYINYILWFQWAFGDIGNTEVDAPSSATAAGSDVVEVHYESLSGAYPNLGVLIHHGPSGEIGRTILDIDTRTNAE
jgi:subtilisin family serine protease